MATLNASSETLRKLLSNGTRYTVPPYQRDYSWTETEWKQLWDDILAILKDGNSDNAEETVKDKDEESEHYMGAVVFQSRGRSSDEFTVIDGQQRLVTLSILVLAAVQILHDLAGEQVDPDDNRARGEELHRRYIGDRDPSSLRSQSKLTLNVENREFYARQLTQRELPRRLAGLSRSNRLLAEAFQYFQERLREKFPLNRGDRIASFVNDQLALQLVFIRVDVQSEQNAYAVFETLNARGTQLTSADLLKNYLLSVVAKESLTDADHAHAQWRRISEHVESRYLPEFLRHYLNSLKSPYTRQERLFQSLRDTIKSRAAVFELLKQLEEAAVWYRAIGDAEDDEWAAIPGAKAAVRELGLFKVTQFKALFLAVVRSFEPGDVAEFLRDCVVVSFRFNIIGNRNTGDLESVYNDLACQIVRKEIQSARELRGAMRRTIYVEDAEFKDEFAHREIGTGSRKKLVKYIFCRLEKQLSGADLDYDSAAATIEHILPDRGGDGWDELFPGAKQERFASRLGNYTLLEMSLNHRLGQSVFAAKRPVYASSQYALTRQIDVEEWTPGAIERRQEKLANVATAVWRLPE